MEPVDLVIVIALGIKRLLDGLEVTLAGSMANGDAAAGADSGDGCNGGRAKQRRKNSGPDQIRRARATRRHQHHKGGAVG